MPDADGSSDGDAAPVAQLLRILVVDDHHDGGAVFELLLRSMGYETMLMRDAENLNEVVRSFQPHAVFLDISLPGMDGREAARRLRREIDLKDVFLVAHTAHGTPNNVLEFRNVGFDAHLHKPLQIEKLLALLAEARNRARCNR